MTEDQVPQEEEIPEPTPPRNRQTVWVELTQALSDYEVAKAASRAAREREETIFAAEREASDKVRRLRNELFRVAAHEAGAPQDRWAEYS